ncbi:phosphoribosylglycinamide formyltransferase [Sphingomonas prati]|uniref:Phosphoribosylglycinamide formyltransferase n=1 Tax=Sphingomonas prati TaxID=1843237 RepID=A0A7W9F0T0_9SPHN|nr:phosphoribosylglycinamide formyltransferase [Sphingomonas prati]MBB5728568.1 formyltetrahydrofolate-dependent phosphoribosylglycinamide formyltransferase [Sphingomonas prati]GGE72750.1 phosphoribosylglycinamide formyltransferase [Sphingomonas prati]
MADPRVPVAILISGRGSNMAALIAAAEADDCPYRVVLVAANDPAAGGLAIAEAAGIATFALSHKGMPRAAFDALLDAEIRRAGAEWIALAGYMRVLSAEFILGWAGRIVNIHPSLLPLYKGLDTHARAIAAGDAEGGCSVHIVTAELDDGPVVAQARVPILPGDDADTLAARVLPEEHRLYPATLAELVRR